jgi:molybdenum cofactor cytidylyltransferase
MKFGPVSLEHAEGKILGHNIAGPEGRRVLSKGKPLTAEDIEVLRRIGRMIVYVAELEPGDVAEDDAARRLAEAAKGDGVRLSGSATGRVNFLSTVLGVLRVDPKRLTRINHCEGITVATLLCHSVVRPRQMVATVKVIPYALPEATVRQAEALASEGSPLIRVDKLPARKVGLILTGSPAVREKITNDFSPLAQRVEALGSEITATEYISLEDDTGEAELAGALSRLRSQGVDLILLAGETAIMDRHDLAPRAIERAGGRVECLGSPVDPGNLLMLAYLGSVPILGAPGCARSRKTNVIDWVLPRLLVGDRLSRTDILSLGHGGLLEDVPERPMPRSRLK